MMLYGRLGFVSTLFLFVGLILTGVPRTRADDRREARQVLAALHEMREAREAKHDFGGHRAKAIKVLDYAAEEVEAALKTAR